MRGIWLTSWTVLAGLLLCWSWIYARLAKSTRFFLPILPVYSFFYTVFAILTARDKCVAFLPLNHNQSIYIYTHFLWLSATFLWFIPPLHSTSTSPTRSSWLSTFQPPLMLDTANCSMTAGHGCFTYKLHHVSTEVKRNWLYSGCPSDKLSYVV